MATTNAHRRHVLALAVLLIVGIHILGTQKVAASCKESTVPSLKSRCSRFVRIPGPKVEPSYACCQAVKEITVGDLPCLCKLITPAVQRVISMEKAVYVARTCGLPVPPGTVCGTLLHQFMDAQLEWFEDTCDNGQPAQQRLSRNQKARFLTQQVDAHLASDLTHEMISITTC